jgi:hypothetical protein
MIHIESGKSQIAGKGSDLILELAFAINTIREAFGKDGEEAVQLAMKMSKSEVLNLFTKSDTEVTAEELS